jgi:hypothetical protein
MGATSNMDMDPGLTRSGIGWVSPLRYETGWADYNSVRDENIPAIKEERWGSGEGDPAPESPDFFLQARKADNFMSGRTPRRTKTPMRRSFNDYGNLDDHCRPVVEMDWALIGPGSGNEPEEFYDLESLPTTESDRALWSFCDAKTARRVEGYRHRYRRDFRRHLRPPPGSHICRLAARFSDCVSVLAGGLATIAILNFNQALGESMSGVSDDARGALLRARNALMFV